MTQYIAYYRVSTKRQGRSGLGLEAQEEIVKFFTKNDEIIAKFTEVGSGGSLDKRAKLQEALEMAKQTKAHLIVAKTDRFRNTIQALQICDVLEAAGTKLICCDVPNTDRFTLTLFFAFSERERLMTSIRTKAALKAKRAREGKTIINGAPFHKNKVDTSKAVARSIEVRKEKAHQKQKQIILLAKQLRGDGYSLQKIADSLNSFGYKTSEDFQFGCTQVSRMLRR